MNQATSSTPSLFDFDPRIIPYQYKVIKLVRNDHDYSKGMLEILLSGSYGSAKSLLMAHIGVTHCLMYSGACLLLGRKSMTSLEETILKKVLEHLRTRPLNGPRLVEVESLRRLRKTSADFFYNSSKKIIHFRNESRIICRSWADGEYDKFRSLDISAALIEELTENDKNQFKGAYKGIRNRVGRLPHVHERFLISATNAGAPSDAPYNHFFVEKRWNRKVFLSNTKDNPFLSEDYIEQISDGLTELEYQRNVEGKWVEITSKNLYYAYDRKMSFGRSKPLDVNSPIYFSFDFNIALNKPMSATVSQVLDIGGEKYFNALDEVVIFSARTLDVMEEIKERGYLEYCVKYIINGDATGRRRDTRSKSSDYDVIREFLSNCENAYGKPIDFEIDVGLSNPPIRQRHKEVNGQLKNHEGKVRVLISKKCENLDKAFRLTKLLKGSNYQEDDTDPYQHVGTAFGYHICRYMSRNHNEKRFQKTKQR